MKYSIHSGYHALNACPSAQKRDFKMVKLLKCSICQKYFKYEKPPLAHYAPLPTICGHVGEDGRWVKNPACKRERNRRASEAYRLKKGRAKTNLKYRYCLQCGKRFKTTSHINTICSDECRKIRKAEANKRYAEGHGKYDYRETPKSKIKRRCKWPGCSRLTSYGGVDFFYCDYHKFVLEQRGGYSEQYPDMIYDCGVYMSDVRAIKDGLRSEVI